MLFLEVCNATLCPTYIFFLQEACRFYMIESGFALMVAFLINVSVISVSGEVCNSSNLNPHDSESCKNLDLNEASFLLKVCVLAASCKTFLGIILTFLAF